MISQITDRPNAGFRASDDVDLPLGTRQFVVVYQFGNVANGAVTSALASVDCVVATQVHFLGSKSFAEIVELLVDPRRSSESYRVLREQLIANISTERAIATVRARKYPGVQLSILSMTREPLAWFRVSVARDVEGLLSDFEAIAAQDIGSNAKGEEAITVALPLVCESIVAILEASGGIDPFLVADARERAAAILAHAPLSEAWRINECLARFLRPYGWFSEHFGRYLGLDVARMEILAKQVYRAQLGLGARAYVMRYEDLDANFDRVTEDMGIHTDVTLATSDVADDTPVARALDEGFAASPIERIQQLSGDSWYAKQFGYSA